MRAPSEKVYKRLGWGPGRLCATSPKRPPLSEPVPGGKLSRSPAFPRPYIRSTESCMTRRAPKATRVSSACVLAFVIWLAGCGGGGGGDVEPSPTPAAIQVVSGNEQSGE